MTKAYKLYIKIYVKVTESAPDKLVVLSKRHTDLRSEIKRDKLDLHDKLRCYSILGREVVELKEFINPRLIEQLPIVYRMSLITNGLERDVVTESQIAAAQMLLELIKDLDVQVRKDIEKILEEI